MNPLMGDESAYTEFRTIKEPTLQETNFDEWCQKMADATFEAVEELGDELFPEYLWTPMINTFPDDDYILRAIIVENSSPEVRMLRHKYTSYYDWADAMDIYNAELDKLIQIYGSKGWVKVGLREGIIPAFLPKKPILKNSKENRKIMRAGIPPQRPIPSKLSTEELREVYDAYAPITPEMDKMEDEDFQISLKDMPKKQRKLIISILERQIVTYRKQGIRKKEGNTLFGLDAITNFMASSTVYKYDAKGEYQEKALVDIIAEEEKYLGWPEEIIEDRIGGPKQIGFIRGQLTDAQTADLTELYSYLLDQGYNIKLNKGFIKRNGLPETSVRMLERKLGSRMAGPMSEKELKRLKKDQKKALKNEKKRKQAEYEASKIMSQALCDGSTLFRGEDGELISLSDRLKQWD